MTWHHFRGTVLPPIPPIGSGLTAVTKQFTVRTHWVEPYLVRVCPRCLEEQDGRWSLPFVFACLRHRCYLMDTCPRCGARLNVAGLESCVVRVKRDSAASRHCGGRVRDSAAARVRDPQILALQQRLLAAVDAPPDQRPQALADLRDLWVMATMTMYTASVKDLSGADPVVRKAFAGFCGRFDDRQGRTLTVSQLRSPRVGVLAAALRIAAQVVFADDPLSIAAEIAGLNQTPRSERALALAKAWDSSWYDPGRLDSTERVAPILSFFVLNTSSRHWQRTVA